MLNATYMPGLVIFDI